MKLRNKKTDEIGYTAVLQSKAIVVMDENAIQLGSYSSLAELNEDWEDYEEPKKYYYISYCGDVYGFSNYYVGSEIEEDHREIGNLFETKEEAERAVEKLKAWKRLKAQGFRFNGGDDACISYRIDSAKWNDKLSNDFDLLFGGEE